jgi:hypothetical protein
MAKHSRYISPGDCLQHAVKVAAPCIPSCTGALAATQEYQLQWSVSNIIEIGGSQWM